MKLTNIINIEGIITLESGLHIGAGNDEMHIGGTDNPIIKNPHNGDPYIPGSSLKGKIRSLLELESGLMAYTRGEPVSIETLNKVQNDEVAKNKCEKILKLFGASGDNRDLDDGIGVTRASFADCSIEPEWRKEARAKNYVVSDVKSENTINRIAGTAKNPRQTERVPEGAKFVFKVSVKQFELDGDALINYLLDGMKLAEMDAIGGSGSRGYGRFSFSKLTVDGKDITADFAKRKPFDSAKLL